MREIKFRAWDFDNGVMCSDFFVCSGGNILEYAEDKHNTPHTEIEKTSINYSIMQYTGLKDKNGKEIYEGDIVVKDGYIWFVDDGVPNYRGVVEWYYSGWNVSVVSVNENNSGRAVGCELNDGGLEEGELSEWSIIGNIHENKELLK